MVSATFGNEMWSSQGAGLTRITKAIQVRVGNSVRLVLQNEKEAMKKKKETQLSAEAKKERFLAEAAKRDQLLAEVENDKKKAIGQGFGLFKKNFGLWDDKKDEGAGF